MLHWAAPSGRTFLFGKASRKIICRFPKTGKIPVIASLFHGTVFCTASAEAILRQTVSTINASASPAGIFASQVLLLMESRNQSNPQRGNFAPVFNGTRNICIVPVLRCGNYSAFLLNTPKIPKRSLYL